MFKFQSTFELEPLKSPLDSETLKAITEKFGPYTKDRFLFDEDTCLTSGASDELLMVLQIVSGGAYHCTVCKTTHYLDVKEEKVS